MGIGKKVVFAVVLLGILCSTSLADIWGKYTNFGLNLADDLFAIQVGRSPIMEENGTNIDYGIVGIGHYVNDSTRDADLHVRDWSVGAFIRYPLLNWSGVEAPVQGKLFVEASLVVDVTSMEEWYTPIGVSAHVLLDRKINEAGIVSWEVMAVGGYQYVRDAELYGSNNLVTGGLVIRWRDD